MKAMILDEQNNFKWADVPKFEPKADEVLIKVAAAAVNRADLMQKDGQYPSPPEWPQWCGLEVSGLVESAPEGSRFKVGDKVCALLGGGGYSEYVVVPQGMVIPIPENMDIIHAAGLPEVWCTVYLNLMYEAGGIKPGEVFFVQAGASGIGIAAIQLAKNMGAKVVTTVGSDEKAAFVKSVGADIAVNYRREKVKDVLKDNPPSVALDCVGGAEMGSYLEDMAFGGRWIIIATLAGKDTTVDLRNLFKKRLKLIGSTLRSRTSEEKSRIMSSLEKELWPLFTQGKLVNHIHAVYPISEVEAAHGVLRRSENTGKVILTF
ncbi:MAG: NAD(P)H-quinone oxidoreductase [Lentisphaerae bacterium]|nr:NAD(P)H-quinone oxidoreductase [Lentisphaerota bacterium]